MIVVLLSSSMNVTIIGTALFTNYGSHRGFSFGV